MALFRLVLIIQCLFLSHVITAEVVPDVDTWKGQLASSETNIQSKAVSQWLEGNLRNEVPDSELLTLFLPIIKSYNIPWKDETPRGLLIDRLFFRLGPQAKAALPDLITLAVDDKANSHLRKQAITALGGRISPKDPEIIAALMKILENPNSNAISGVHDNACTVLGNMGKAADAARPVIEKWLMHESKIHQDAAFNALGQINETDLALPIMQQLERLKNLDNFTHSETAAAFLALKTASKNKDPQVNIALPTLASIISNHRKTVFQRAALRIVANQGPGAEPAMVQALLQACLEDGEYLARVALMQIEGTNPKAAAILISALQEHWDDWDARQCIAGGLSNFGALARPAVPSLIKALLQIEEKYQPGRKFYDKTYFYIQILNEIGTSEPEIQSTYLALLAPDSTFIESCGEKYTNSLRVFLYESLSKIEFPKDSPSYNIVVERVKEGLGSDDLCVFNAAAATASQCTTVEMIPLFMRAFTAEDDFKRHDSFRDYLFIEGQITVVKALEKLGPLAKVALPKIKELAGLPIPPIGGFDHNAELTAKLIEAAQKALAAIEMK